MAEPIATNMEMPESTGATGTETFAGPTGTLQLDSSQTFTGKIAGFGGQDVIDPCGYRVRVGYDAWISGERERHWRHAERERRHSQREACAGALVVYEAVIDDERRKNVFGLLMSLNMLIETPAESCRISGNAS